MSTESDLLQTIEAKTAHYKKELDAYIKSNQSSALFIIIAGVLIMLAGLFITQVILQGLPPVLCWHYAYCYSCYMPLIVPILAIIGAIVLFTIYKSCLKQAEFYRNERIVLHDLNMALYVCLSIPEDVQFTKTVTTTGSGAETKTIEKHVSEQTKVKQQIVQALLNKCS